MHSRNWFCSWEAGRSGSRRRRQRRLWMSPRPSPSQTQAPRTGCSPQQDNHTARCTHRFQAVYAHLEDSGRKADVTLAGGGLPARKRTARPRLTRMWSTWARLRRWTRSFRWGYDERPRHNAQTDRVLELHCTSTQRGGCKCLSTLDKPGIRILLGTTLNCPKKTRKPTPKQLVKTLPNQII